MTVQSDTLERPTEQMTWPNAVAEYARAKAELERKSAEHDKANAAYEASVPEPKAEFAAYRLDYAENDRDTLIRRAEMGVLVLEIAPLMIAQGRDKATDAEYALMTERATAIVDDFIAWREEQKKAKARLYDDAEKAWEAALDAERDAYDALLRTPAPNSAAMLHKLNLLVADMTEGDEGDTDRVAAIRDDARRLLGAA